jgi:hypothetical protein
MINPEKTAIFQEDFLCPLDKLFADFDKNLAEELTPQRGSIITPFEICFVCTYIDVAIINPIRRLEESN